MLKSARVRQYAHGSFESALSAILSDGHGETTEIETGIYLVPHHNFGNDIANKKNDYFTFGDYELSPYGVCDTIEQFKQKYAYWLEAPNLNFCISFCKVVKSEQPEWDGWRWHKWGEYIGEYEITCEYLFDEPIVESVYCYHVYELLD